MYFYCQRRNRQRKVIKYIVYCFLLYSKIDVSTLLCEAKDSKTFRLCSHKHLVETKTAAVVQHERSHKQCINHTVWTWRVPKFPCIQGLLLRLTLIKGGGNTEVLGAHWRFWIIRGIPLKQLRDVNFLLALFLSQTHELADLALSYASCHDMLPNHRLKIDEACKSLNNTFQHDKPR